MFETACPQCGRGFNVRDDWRGKRAECQSCGSTFAIAAAEPPVLLTDENVVDEYELEPLAAPTTDPLSAALFESDSQRPAPAPGFIARRSTCSDPGKIALSRKKLDLLVPGFFTPWGRLKRLVLGLIHRQIHTAHAIEQQLWYGDSRAAVVMSRDPLLVAGGHHRRKHRTRRLQRPSAPLTVRPRSFATTLDSSNQCTTEES